MYDRRDVVNCRREQVIGLRMRGASTIQRNMIAGKCVSCARDDNECGGKCEDNAQERSTSKLVMTGKSRRCVRVGRDGEGSWGGDASRNSARSRTRQETAHRRVLGIHKPSRDGLHTGTEELTRRRRALGAGVRLVAERDKGTARVFEVPGIYGTSTDEQRG